MRDRKSRHRTPAQREAIAHWRGQQLGHLVGCVITRVASLAAAIQQAVEAWCEGEEDEAGGTAGCTCVPPGPYLTAEEVATYQEACNEEPIEKHQENCALRMRHSTEAGGTDA